MMTTRVSDSELAARVRQRNRVNSERRRQRLNDAGKVQLLTWIPGTLRRELDNVAAARGEPLSETTTALLSLALQKIASTVACDSCGWEGRHDEIAGDQSQPRCPTCGAYLRDDL